MTADQVRAKFDREGRTFAEFAREHDLNVNEIYKILNGQNKGHHGRAHHIAVLLGIKPGAKPQA